ncbi:MAG: hypothetical protein ACI83H_001494 [Glaciecola sp.]|jgi:hypothetical protein
MKYFLVITIMVLGITSLSAQEKGKVRVGIDLGYVFAKDGGGALFNLEPKYNLTDNSNIGLRLGTSASVSDSENEIDSNLGFLGTYDYYFNQGTSSVAPFLGVGLGAYILGELKGGSGLSAALGSQFGGMIRGGFELGKFRLALEYNIIPKSDLEIGESIDNSYFGASIGFYVGGGKWKK